MEKCNVDKGIRCCSQVKHPLLLILEPVGVESITANVLENEIEFEFRKGCRVKNHIEKYDYFEREMNCIASLWQDKIKGMEGQDILIEHYTESTKIELRYFLFERIMKSLKS